LEKTLQIFSSNTNGTWLQDEGQDGQEQRRPNPFEQEVHRALSEVFRCNNLIILAGLGTSLCVTNVEGRRLAPTMADLWGKVRFAHDAEDLVGDTWDDFLALVRHDPLNPNLEKLLSQCRLAEAFLTGQHLAEVQAFGRVAEKVVYAEVNFLKTNHDLPAHNEFLRRVARRSNRKSRTRIFTTNYDRCFEEAGRQGRYVIVDGFSHTMPPTFDAVYFTYDVVRRGRENDVQDYIPNVFHLYKLHGSIDWQRETTSGEIHKVSEPTNPLLIYPRSSKYELAFEQPYLEMMSALQSALREPDTGLLVVGFGFNDNHLSEPIMAAIRSNLALKAVVVSPGLAPWVDADGAVKLGEAGLNGHLRRIRDLARNGDARLTLLNCRFDELVPLVPDIAAETDLERHVQRLRKLDEEEL
jgi:hypothetical protein